MEAQLANLAHWVQSAVVHSGGSTGAPSSVKSTSSSVTSESTSPLVDSASSSKCMVARFSLFLFHDTLV